MAQYQVPTDISEKEKIVGGLFTAGQLFSILIGTGAGLGLGFLTMAFGGPFFLALFAILGIAGGIVFAFLKIHGLPLMKYLNLRKKHLAKEKHLPNHKKEIDNFEISYLSVDKIIK